MDQKLERCLENLKRVHGAERDSRRCGLPMSGHPRPPAMSIARRAEPRRAARYEKRQFPQRKLDGRGDRGTKMAPFSNAVVCIKGII